MGKDNANFMYTGNRVFLNPAMTFFCEHYEPLWSFGSSENLMGFYKVHTY